MECRITDEAVKNPHEFDGIYFVTERQLELLRKVVRSLGVAGDMLITADRPANAQYVYDAKKILQRVVHKIEDSPK